MFLINNIEGGVVGAKEKKKKGDNEI